MAYLIAIVAVLMVVGSVLWLKPSKAQQRQTMLRLLARQLGLDVRLCNLPQSRRARVREVHPDQGVVYRLPIFERREPPLPEYLLCRENADSPWVAEKRVAEKSAVEKSPAEAEVQLSPALRALVEKVAAELPADAVALELGPQGPAVYWRERGDENTLRRLHQALVELRAALLDK
ncbi:MAG TPA: hypothetical protein VLC91_16735 [Spongiibacteraceae bacterium]|nr:hypothetical protein [Spongiibacteraceae bacterium]